MSSKAPQLVYVVKAMFWVRLNRNGRSPPYSDEILERNGQQSISRPGADVAMALEITISDDVTLPNPNIQSMMRNVVSEKSKSKKSGEKEVSSVFKNTKKLLNIDRQK